METFVEGHTEPIEYDLKKAPAPGATAVVFDATGMDLAMTITRRDGTTVSTSGGKVQWADQANSRARFSPAAGDLVASQSPYRVHWHVTDTDDKEASWPKGEAEEWIVVKR